MKGLYKGFKYTLSQIFGITTVQSVDFVKEREMEIGYPTDVKHVAHVGWDGPSGSAPSWMSEFKTGPDFAATSIGNSFSALSPWSSRDFSESMRRQPSESEVFKDASSSERSSTKKKLKWKMSKSSSSPKSYSSSSSRSSRAGKSKSSFTGVGVKPANIEVS